MADYPPFMNAYGSIPKILEKVKTAKAPDRFTQDFLETVLGFPGGSRRPFIPLVKRLGLLGSDGSPTDLYHKFRNDDHTKGAMAQAIRNGYPTLFDRNQYAYKLDKNKLEGLVMEATGLDAGSKTLKAIVGTLEALKPFADFETSGTEPSPNGDQRVLAEVQRRPFDTALPKDDGIRFSYTFYLNLPNTSDISVFNAIFKSFREQVLNR
jgi:hypothetical protein